MPVAPDGVSVIRVDPIEKKPLHHFRPGARTLSIGTIGCPLTCAFCQNEALSRCRDPTRTRAVSAASVPGIALENECPIVAFTYNDPIVSIEWTIAAARACRERGLETVAVTAGYVTGAARRALFEVIDAANVDLKSLNDAFYRARCGARLDPVLDTLRHIRRETATWLEVTTLIIPGANDGEEEIERAARWIADELGGDTPWHLSAFHPAGGMTDTPATPHATLARAHDIGRRNGLRHVFVGNLRDPRRASTLCPSCGAILIARDGFSASIEALRIDETGRGRCGECGERVAGRFGPPPGGPSPSRAARGRPGRGQSAS